MSSPQNAQIHDPEVKLTSDIISLRDNLELLFQTLHGSLGANEVHVLVPHLVKVLTGCKSLSLMTSLGFFMGGKSRPMQLTFYHQFLYFSSSNNGSLGNLLFAKLILELLAGQLASLGEKTLIVLLLIS
ncbi:hypothetical protein VNO78_10633 [Psophocarpus tetragonolobus]|uniref:Uncharacterized protein n=1 Tax=Psophocarpus tetragonolobus TaxID=3891 RepID=A0AAN9SKY7_PSOTE